MSSPPYQVIRRRPPSPPVYLLDVVVERGGRTQIYFVDADVLRELAAVMRRDDLRPEPPVINK